MSLERAFNLRTHRSRICGGIDDGKPPRFPAGQIQVSRPDALVEKQPLLFEAGLHHVRRIGIDPSMWCALVWDFKRYFGRSRAAGRPDNLKQEASAFGYRWVRGQRSVAECFT